MVALYAYDEVSGDAKPENNPEYQYPGYIYCDGSEYKIVDYPAYMKRLEMNMVGQQVMELMY